VSNKTNDKSVSFQPSWAIILGLSSPQETEWGEVRAAQIKAVRDVALSRMVFSILGAIVVFASLRADMPDVMLLGWFICFTLVTAVQGVFQLRRKNETFATASRFQLLNETSSLILSSLCWATLPFAFSIGASPHQMLIIWTVMTAFMGMATFALSPLPLAASGFIFIMGGSLGYMMWQLELPYLSAAALAYSGSLTAACLANGRSFVCHTYASRSLREKNEVVSLLLREYEDSGGDWMWQTDASRCLTHVSPRMAIALGVEPTALEAKPFLQILAGETWEAGNFGAGLRDLADRLKNRESFSDLVLPVQIGNETRWWELSASPRIDETGVYLGFRGVGSDITEQQKSADKINRMARFDTLTGLPNRLSVTEALSTAMAEADRWRSRCGFMMIDLDRFKAVNDTLGHPIGDRLLTLVSQRLRSIMTDNEMCGRLGGDEFAVVVKDASDPSKMERVARKIIETLSAPYEVEQNTLYIGASVGTAVGPRDGRSVEMLIRSADLALYRSKDSGGSAFNAYEPQLHVHAEERRVLEIALRKALERKEFEVHYQPVVNAKTGVIESFEALLRWNNKELGMVSPMKFIPIAEETRLIGSIGEWVLRTACAEAAGWPSHIKVAVNVSAEQLHDASFVATIVSALAHAGLPPHRLELEVTESVFMKEGTGAVAVLERILALGVKLALDDFGTGYSSLGYLSKTKFSTIKIDRSFVQGASRKLPESIAIIRAVVALADSLGMMTTAEGVETDEECRMINDLGCRKIQGYLFGRPMPAHEARQLFNSETGAAQVA
jgi:diguanylate cyclase (GGDEF)-like protein